jgi:hypothetical protein
MGFHKKLLMGTYRYKGGKAIRSKKKVYKFSLSSHILRNVTDHSSKEKVQVYSRLHSFGLLVFIYVHVRTSSTDF